MGVAGVAWATFLCQGVSCILAILVVLRRLAGVKTEKRAAIFSWRLLGKISVIAIPSILQQSFISVGNIIIQSVINSFGASVIAGYSASVKLNNLVIPLFTTLGNGISNYTAQNIGAQKMERVKQGFRAGLKLVWILCVPLFLAYFFAGRYLVFLFMDNSTGPAIDTGIQFLRILSPFYFCGIRKAGGRWYPTRRRPDAKLHDCHLHRPDPAVALAIGLARVFGSIGIWCAWPIGWTIAMCMSVWFYKCGPWNKKKEA